MGYLRDHCQFAPVTKELLSGLGDFSCADETDISDFFKSKSFPSANEMLSKSYCLFDADKKEMVAAFCVLNATLSTERLPNYSKRSINKELRYEKQRKQYPATLIGQFVVFDKFRKLRLGNELMQFVLSWIMVYAQNMGNRFAVVDAINKPKVLQFYEDNHFRYMFRSDEEELQAMGKNSDEVLNTRMMYFDLMNINSRKD